MCIQQPSSFAGAQVWNDRGGGDKHDDVGGVDEDTHDFCRNGNNNCYLLLLLLLLPLLLQQQLLLLLLRMVSAKLAGRP